MTSPPVRILSLLACLIAPVTLASCEPLWVLEVTITGEGIGRVQSPDGSFQCEQLERGVARTCVENFREGLSVQLEVDEEDAELIGWEGACAGGEKTCTVDLSRDRTVRVGFRAIRYDVSVVAHAENDGRGRVMGPGFDCVLDGQLEPTGECVRPFVKDAEITLTATPSSGSRLGGAQNEGWLACNAPPQDGRCTVFVDKPNKEVQAWFVSTTRPLEVRGAGPGSGRVQSTPTPEINCSIQNGETVGACKADFDLGSQVTLESQASPGSVFSAWMGDCDGTESTCTVEMDRARTVTASFGIASHTLTVGGMGEGSGRVTSATGGIDCVVQGGVAEPAPGGACNAEFDHGTPVTLTAETDEGSTLDGWVGCAEESGGECTVTLDSDREVGVEFGLEQYELSVELGGEGDGSVVSDPPGIACSWTGQTTSGECDWTFAWGTTVTLTATEGDGSSLASWSVAGCQGLVCDVVITGDRTVTVAFDKIPLPTLEVTGLGNGNGTVRSEPEGIDCRILGGQASPSSDCSEAFQVGVNVTLHAEPDDGSRFDAWEPECSASGACEITMTESTLVAAQFSLQEHTVTVVAEGGASGRVTSVPAGIDCEIVDGAPTGPNCDFQFPHGTSLTLQADASSGSAFAGWSGPCSGAGDCVLVVTQDTDVTARFDLGSWNVTVQGAGTGGAFVTGEGINCRIDDGVGSDTCFGVFEHLDPLTLTAEPDADTRFVGWSGDCTGTGDCPLTVDQDLIVTATFARQHELSVLGGGTGSGSVTSTPPGITCTISAGATSDMCQSTFDEGVAVVLTASGAFDAWEGCDSADGPECSVSLTEDRVVTATFANPQLLLSTDRVTAAATVNGDDPRVRRVWVYNDGGGAITNLQASAPVDWLEFEWSGGDDIADPKAILEVYPLTGDLPLGTVSTTVTVSGEGVTEQTFEVEFEVIRGITAEAAAENVRMHGLSDSNLGVQYDTAYVTIRNGGRGRLTDLNAVVISTNPDAMDVDLLFTPDPDAPTELRIIGGCAFEDPFLCEAEIDWGSGMDQLAKIFVEYLFNQDPELRVEPQGLTLTAFEGGDPVSASVDMIDMNPGSHGHLADLRLASADPVFQSEWLTAERQGALVTITADPAGLVADASLAMEVTVVADQVIIEEEGGEVIDSIVGGSTDVLDVILVVQRGLEVSLTETDIYVPLGGGPEEVEVELSNGSAVTLEGLLVQSDESWLVPSVGGATDIQPGAGGVTLTLTADPTTAGLVEGTHTATVTVSSTTEGTPDETITVTVHVF